ncbi:MAG: SUMF1/EgtB/PvdO family nonheme iron enzyme [Chloroflexota bacterium]
MEKSIWGGIEFVKIPAGPFLMGSKGGNLLAYADETPQHEVDIPYNFWISRYPITNLQFLAFVEAVQYVTTAEQDTFKEPQKAALMSREIKLLDFQNWRHPAPGYAAMSDSIENKLDYPVVRVSWFDGMAFCSWMNKRYCKELPSGYAFGLPSEAEWEKAARGEKGYEWPWGDEWDNSKCNSAEGGPKTITSVYAYSPQGDSIYGVADMVGNVWEWTRSLAHYHYPYVLDDGREDLNASINSARTMRGGSYREGRKVARCACRAYDLPDSPKSNIGFRLALCPSQLKWGPDCF